MDYAASKGRVDIMDFLHTNRKEGCSERAFSGAAAEGHLEARKWLYKNRPGDICYIDDMVNYAIRNGQLEVLKWTYKTKLPPKSKFSRLFQEGFKHAVHIAIGYGGHLAVLKWLYKKDLLQCVSNGLLRNALGEAMDNEQMHVVQWVDELHWSRDLKRSSRIPEYTNAPN